MIESQRELLEQEQIVGRRADNAYSNFVKSFIEQKKIMLVESFTTCPISELDTILEIKRTLYVLDALDIEMRSLVETGKMASQALNREPLEKH